MGNDLFKAVQMESPVQSTYCLDILVPSKAKAAGEYSVQLGNGRQDGGLNLFFLYYIALAVLELAL